MRNSNAIIYNLIAIIFSGLTIFAFLCTLLMFARVVTPPAFLQPAGLATPTVVQYPTETITPTPSITPIPSNTPIPPTTTPVPPSATPSVTPSSVPPTATALPPSPTFAPTATLPPLPTLPPAANTAVPPTAIPTRRITATPTRRVVPTRTPIGFVPSRTPVGVFPTQTLLPTLKPQSNQPFVLEDGFPTKGPNPDFGVACNYMGIAGTVTDLAGQPIRTRFKVNITGPDKKVITTQPNPQNDALYSPGSFVAQLAAAPIAGTYTVQLFTRQNKAISDPITITFTAGPSACNENVAYVSFLQVKPASLP